ncbi:MAG: Slp family lipoprotein [Nitrospira sp.]|nr:Slp family lipoprotein [Nitrospira sp.]
MKSSVSLLILSWVLVGACAPTHKVFPSKMTDNVDHNFDFSRWRMMTDGSESKKVQLGGRIVSSQASGGTVTIVVGQLPIVNHPAYGPKDNGKNNGDFVIVFQGHIDESDLQSGNRVMVVGTTRPWKVVTVNDYSRSFPIVEAQCLHFWNTQGREIADFPFYEAGYVSLRQETVCAKNATP